MPAESTTRIGGIVLCGGKSSRMGQPKAWLPFGNETFLQRVVRILGDVVSPVVVVAAVGQDLPPLPADVLVTRDELEALGPVGGLAAGFAALRGQVDAVYVSGCDVPLLKPEVVRYMCRELAENDVAVPIDGQFPQPLAAVYRLSLADKIQSLLESNRLRPVFLWEGARVSTVPVDALRIVDPQLDSFRNANTPEDYAEICKIAKM